MTKHMLIRFFEHIILDIGWVVIFFCILEYLKEKLEILPDLRARLMLACLIVTILVAGREALDLHSGQPYPKVWSDWLSHAIGIPGGGWFGVRWLIRKEWPKPNPNKQFLPPSFHQND